jgi:hypothetical protein
MSRGQWQRSRPPTDQSQVLSKRASRRYSATKFHFATVAPSLSRGRILSRCVSSGCIRRFPRFVVASGGPPVMSPCASRPAGSLGGKSAAQYISSLSLTRHRISFEYPFPPNEVVAFFRQYYNTIGPTQTAFKRLDRDGQAALASALDSLWKKHNRAGNDRTSVEVEYLDVRADSRLNGAGAAIGG